jgi:hypothetical protein
MSRVYSDELVARLHLVAESDDTECAHGEADNILCELLTRLGYNDVVTAYEAVDKWYA